MDQFSRTQRLFGHTAMERLKSARVILFGVGGVGGMAAEALARGGIGALTLVDPDEVALTNLNRQIVALHSTLGKKKAEVMRARILDINPQAEVTAEAVFYNEETAEQFDLAQYDYVVDAIDTVSSKILLVQKAKEAGVPIISCMGAGNKLDPSRFEVADLYETSVCPLAKIMRRELKSRGIDSLKVVYSREAPQKLLEESKAGLDENLSLPFGTMQGATIEHGSGGMKQKRAPASNSFVPPAAGLVLAGAVLRDLAGIE